MNAASTYERHGRALLRKAERVLQSRADAQDLVQALFLDLLQSERRETEVVLDLPYLFRAVTNRCLTFLRDAKNRERLLREHDVPLLGGARVRADERAIGVDMLCKLVCVLDEETTQVVVYRYLDEMTQEEIADLTGVSRKTVGKRLEAAQRAIEQLGELPEARGS